MCQTFGEEQKNEKATTTIRNSQSNEPKNNKN